MLDWKMFLLPLSSSLQLLDDAKREALSMVILSLQEMLNKHYLPSCLSFGAWSLLLIMTTYLPADQL